MVEITKDFIKLIATLIVVLSIFVVVFNSGILENLFALKTYAEPLTLLDHIASTIETASSCPGECSFSVRTSGLPYILQIYKEDGRYYASIDASLVEQKTNVKFLPNEQKPIFTKPLISDCIISEQKLAFTEGLIQDLNIEKVIEGDTCTISIGSKKVLYDFNITVDPDTLLVLNGTSSATTVTVYLIGGSIAPGPVALSTIGLPPDVTIRFDKNDVDPTFSSTAIVTAGLTAAPGTYNVTITGTSGGLMRTATLQIEVSSVLYTFILNSAISIIKLPLTNVSVILNSITKNTRQDDEFTSSIIYSMIPGTPYSVKVENLFADPQGPRPFSHFRDFDCKGNETNYILDTGVNAYPFTVPNEYNIVYSRKMTAFYKDFTQIRNLEFDNVTNIISGSLLDEDFNSISKEETSYTACNVSTTVYPNRNVDLYYLNSCSNSWQLLDSIASSFAQNRFYDKFDKDRNNWDIKSGTWNITNDALNNSGIGYESIQTKWNFWNSSDNGNNNLEVSVNLSYGNNVSIRVFDAFDNYYLQTNDSYNNLYLWVNGALKASVPLAGIVPNQWNTWRIRQNDSYLEFYINNIKLIRFYNAPPIDFGRVEFRTFNTQAYFDNVTAYDGSWSYNFDVPCSAKKIKASYASSDWFYDDTSSVLDIDPTTNPCKLTVNTQIDIGENQESEPLPGIEVNVSDGVLNKIYTKTTAGPLAIAEYFMSSSFFPVHNITVNDTFDSRYFSHFYDQDCDPSNANYWLDNASNPYWFSMCRDKNITAQYKTFTNITNFNFDFPSRKISGYLLDENDYPIINRKGIKHSTCTPQTSYDNITINRNVTLEYFKNGRWYTIGANNSLADGSWSYNWGCACNATKLRANYTPIGGNWWYMPNSTEINIVCPCALTVITQIDVLSTLLSGVRVNVSNIINHTINGIAIYNLFPGSYYINVDNPFIGRPFSHFYDNDCDKSNIGFHWDNALNPYSFGMFDRDKNITAQYKTFTNITDTRGNTNTFEYNGTTITGRLLDENGKALIEKAGGYHPICEISTTINPLLINRNVTLEVYNITDNKWYYLGVANVNPSDNISWSFNWDWTSGATRLRANYTPTNWFYVGTSVEIPLYTLTVFTVLDITNNPAVKNVSVTLNGITKLSNNLGEAYFMITSMNNNIRVDDIAADVAGSRNYSHFWDHDCDGLGHNLDNSSNPYTFRTWNNDRNITAFYKTFTYIKDSVGTKNKFEYDGNVVKGKLQDERDNYIGTGTNKALVCGNPAVSGIMYRNVTLEYFNGTWNKLASVEPDLIDGSWSNNWVCACNTTKIRASYNHTDWYYNSTSTEINVDSSLCPCKLTVITQINVFGSPLNGTKVTLDSLISQNTDVFGKTEFFVRPGFHNITLDTLSDKLNHFYDSDCNKNNQGWWWDKISSPKDTWNFEMYARERTITAQYRALTNITNTTGSKNTFEFNGTVIKGKLLSEDSNALIEHGHYHQFCEDPTNPSTELPVDRKVTLEYYNGSWQPINSIIATPSPANGYWEYPWSCTSDSTKLRANYTPMSSDWFYVGTSVEIPISCMGTLDVYAFVGAGQVTANVTYGTGLGDVDWDGDVDTNDRDLVVAIKGSVPGTPNWDIDADMNLNNIINVIDETIVSNSPYYITGMPIPINKTHFIVDLSPGTYQLRAKYDNQIKNNLTVVVNAGQTTKVNFTFEACDGFTALSCNVPPLAKPGDVRLWLDNVCGRTNAKIDCDGVYDSHKVCNPTNCTLINPTITSYSVSSTNVNVGNPFTVTVNGNCPNALPNDLPGKCLIECNVLDPTYKKGMWHFDEGSGTSVNDASGSHNVGTINGATWQAAINCHSSTCLSFNEDDFVEIPTSSSLDITNTITVDTWIKPNVFTPWARIVGKGNWPNHAYILLLENSNNIKFVVKSGGVEYGCSSPSDSIKIGVWNHVIGVYNGTHVKVIIDDQEKCNDQSIGGGSIDIQPGNLDIGRDPSGGDYFNGLIDEVKVATKDYDRSITLDTWSATGSSAMYPVNCTQEGEYIVDYCAVATDFNINRGWNSLTHTDTTVKCNPLLYQLTISTFEDISNSPISGVPVILDSLAAQNTDATGKVTFLVNSGPHSVKVDMLTGGLPAPRFSHFWDSDCNQTNIGWYLDTNGIPTSGVLGNYSFVMYNRNRNMIAYYAKFTNITNTTGAFNTFDYDWTNIKGRLVDNANNVLVASRNYHPSCESPATLNPLPVNREVTLEYYKGSSWYSINTVAVNPVDNVSWSQPWPYVAGATNLRASYLPSNWYYTYTSATIPVAPNCNIYDKGYVDTDNTPPQIQCSNHNYLSYTSANQMRDYGYNGTACDCNVSYDSYITGNCIKGVCSGDSSVLLGEYVNVTTSIKNTGKNAQTSWHFNIEFWNVSDYNNPGIREASTRAWADFDGSTKTSACNNLFGPVSSCGCVYSEPAATKNGNFDVGETINVSCWIPASYWPISTGNRRVMFWSHERDTGRDAGNNGNAGNDGWDDALSRKEPSEIRAKIEAPTPFTLTFNSQVDITGEKLPGFEVNIDGTIKNTGGADASVTYSLLSGAHSISVINPGDGRYFSHFYDNNCDNLGNAWDNSSNPFTFNMFNNNKNMTAQYKTFTKIKSSSGGTIDNFDGTSMITWAAGCGAGGREVITVSPGYFSNNALRIRTTASGPAPVLDNLTCAVSSPYNAVEGKKINYACYGGRCALCVWGGSAPCLNYPVECGNNIGNWTMCQTTITASNPTTNIYIYNNNTLGGWSVYDLIEESTFDYDGKTVSGKLLDETNNILYQVGGGSPTCGGARQTISIDKTINLGYYTGSWNPIGSPKFFDDFNDNEFNNPLWIPQSGTWSVPWGELNNTGFGDEQIVTNWSGWSGNNFLSANVRLEKFNPPNTDYDMFVMITNWSHNYYLQTWNGYKDLQLYVADGAGYHHAYEVDIRPLNINPNNWNLWKIDQKGNDLLVYINNNIAMNTSKERKTIDDFEDGNYNLNPTWNLNCGGVTSASMIAGYSGSANALKLTSTGGDGLACAYSSNYNAIEGRKIIYACYGGRCRLGVRDGTKFINDHTCNLNTGQCRDGVNDGIDNGLVCGYGIAGWNICETTITASNPTAQIWVYNDATLGGWSVYDMIENLIKVPTVNNGQIQLRTANTKAFFDDVNVDGVIYYKDGSWSYPWSCGSTGATQLRATYTPSNWYYSGTSAVINVNCPPPLPTCGSIPNNMGCNIVAGHQCSLACTDSGYTKGVCLIASSDCVAPTPCCCICS